MTLINIFDLSLGCNPWNDFFRKFDKWLYNGRSSTTAGWYTEDNFCPDVIQMCSDYGGWQHMSGGEILISD